VRGRAGRLGPRVRDLDRFYAVMHGALRGTTDVVDAARMLGVPAGRLALYRGFVAGHVRRAVEVAHPATVDALGERREATLAAFEAAQPASGWQLRAAAEGFRRFLGAASPAHPEALVERAEFEWALTGAADAPDAPDAPAAASGWRLAPALSALTQRWPTPEAYAAWQRGEPRPLDTLAPLDAPRVVFVFRHPRLLTARWRVADDAVLFVFKCVHDGIAPADAATLTGLQAVQVDTLFASVEAEGLVERLAVTTG